MDSSRTESKKISITQEKNVIKNDYLELIKQYRKEYYDNGQLKFEGEYLNGKIWNGKGNEYNDITSVLFEGEFKKGKKWNNINLKDGKGYLKEYKNNTLIFEGEYLNGERNGKGKE